MLSFANIFLCVKIYLAKRKKLLPLQYVFHGIRFKVNEDWLSGDNHFFVIKVFTTQGTFLSALCCKKKFTFYFLTNKPYFWKISGYLLIKYTGVQLQAWQ